MDRPGQPDRQQNIQSPAHCSTRRNRQQIGNAGRAARGQNEPIDQCAERDTRGQTTGTRSARQLSARTVARWQHCTVLSLRVPSVVLDHVRQLDDELAFLVLLTRLEGVFLRHPNANFH